MGTDIYKKIVSDENGSTSVLVILMMIVLVSLGYFAIASANSNIKLSNNSIDWNDKFYYLDGQGEAFVSEVDRLLYNAQLLTNEYFDSRQYLAFTHPDLPLELHMVIYEGYENAHDKDFFILQSMDTVYFFYANQELDKLKETYPDAIVSSLKDGENVLGIICDTTINHDDAPEYHLNVSVSVNNYTTYRYEKINNPASTAKRYIISGWTQWQNRPVEDEGMELWDGTITTPAP